MDKIKITTLSPCVKNKGFDERGCYGCKCNDACCRYGADIDKISYDLIIKHKALVENIIKEKVENCFEKEPDTDPEFLGGSARRSIVKNGFCVFHLKEGKGCSLYKLVSKDKIPKRIIPSICRLYPLTWENGRLYFENDVESTCNCLEAENVTKRTLFETQAAEVDDIFSFTNE